MYYHGVSYGHHVVGFNPDPAYSGNWFDAHGYREGIHPNAPSGQLRNVQETPSPEFTYQMDQRVTLSDGREGVVWCVTHDGCGWARFGHMESRYLRTGQDAVAPAAPSIVAVQEAVDLELA